MQQFQREIFSITFFKNIRYAMYVAGNLTLKKKNAVEQQEQEPKRFSACIECLSFSIGHRTFCHTMRCFIN